MKNECKGLVGMLYGHNYQPRFTKIPTYDNFSIGRLKLTLERPGPIIYECDVCTRCGDVIRKI